MAGLSELRAMKRELIQAGWVGAVAAAAALSFAARGHAQPSPLDPAEFQVNTYTPCTQDRPAITLGPDESFVVVWQSCGSLEADNDDWSVQARRYSPGGASSTPTEFQVNTYTTAGQAYASVASDAEGNFVVVWESYGSFGSDSDGYSIQARRFAADGTPLDPAEFQVNAYTTSWQQRPKVAMDPEGNFVVVWDSWGSTGDPFAYSIQARRYRAGGEPLDAAEFEVNTFTPNTQFFPTVASDVAGNFVVGWYSHQSLGGQYYTSIQARRYHSDGTPRDPSEFRVDTPDLGDAGAPAIALDPAGNFELAWERTVPITSRESIGARRFSADGTPVDPSEFEVSTYSTSGQDRPSVSAAANGDFVVAWASWGSSGGDDSRWSVQARRYRPQGPAVDAAEFQLNAYTTGSQVFPAIALRPDGDFVVAWQSYGSFGSDTGYTSIQARRFGRPTIEVTSTSGGTGGPGCTLRDAVTAANTGAAVAGCAAGNEGAVIELPPGVAIAFPEPDNGSNGLPVIERPITIRGHGATIARDPGLACPVAPEFRLFEVVAGGILTLEDVTVTNGCVSSGSGGGVLSSGGTVVLREASIEGNESGSDGGGVAIAGGNLLAVDTTVRGNLAAGSGGGISVSGDPGWLLLRRSTVSGNVAAAGGGLAHAGATRALVRASTFSGNVALAYGGGIELEGASPALTLDFSTVAGNASPLGAGAMAGTGVLALNGSLVGESSGGSDCASGAGSVVASGANLDTDGSCAALAGGGVTTVASLGLGPLADNGGWTRTYLPLAGSPALDAAPACANRSGAAVIADERDYPRPTDDDGNGTPACDLGAVERGPVFLDGFESGDARRWSFEGF
jgi:hypothetical protein